MLAQGNQTPQAPIVDPVRVRATVAYLLMAIFICATTTGAFMYSTGAGFIVLGLTSGIVGYLTGNV